MTIQQLIYSDSRGYFNLADEGVIGSNGWERKLYKCVLEIKSRFIIIGTACSLVDGLSP